MPKIDVPFRAGGPDRRHGGGTRDSGCFGATVYVPPGEPAKAARTPEPVFKPNSAAATYWPTRSIAVMNADRCAGPGRHHCLPPGVQLTPSPKKYV